MLLIQIVVEQAFAVESGAIQAKSPTRPAI